MRERFMSGDDEGSEDVDDEDAGVERDVEMPWNIQTMVCRVWDRSLRCHSQWWGEGGSSLGCATVLLAKLLKAAEEGLMQSGTRLEFNCS